MDIKSKYSPEELERRRFLSVEALNDEDKKRRKEWYQKWCDTFYWKNGPCCAGCDHWLSNIGTSGQCTAAGIVSGAEVIRSLGWSFSSLPYTPDFPFTEHNFHCGKFKDDFDWLSLPSEYLKEIGYEP